MTAAFDPGLTEEPASFWMPIDKEELENEVIRLAGHINAAEYRFLKLLYAVEQRAAWATGFKSPAHWLNYTCGIGLVAGREKFRVARCLEDLPLIDEAFRLDQISYSKVRAMTRSATPENEEFVLMMARYGTASHVEGLVRRYRWVKRLQAPEEDKRRYDARELTWYFDDDGMLIFQGKLAPEDGAVFLKSLEALFGQLNKSPPPEEESDSTLPRNCEVRWRRDQAGQPCAAVSAASPEYRLVWNQDGQVDFIHPENGLRKRSSWPQFEPVGDPYMKLAIEEINEAAGLRIDERTAKTLWDGMPCDWSMAVETMFNKERPGQA